MSDLEPSQSAKPTEPSTATESSKSQNNGFTEGTDVWTRTVNWFNLLTGQYTQEGLLQFKHDRDTRFEEKHCKQCEKDRDWNLKYSPVVRFMREKINFLGADLNANNIHCQRCYFSQKGGFDPKFGILLCANHLAGRKEMEDTMAHEMIHAYDHLRFKMQWTTNLHHAACSEIRASSLSGECRWAKEFFHNGQRSFTQQHQRCVRARAILSLTARPNCEGEAHATRIVNEVWDSCFADTRPFDEIYR